MKILNLEVLARTEHDVRGGALRLVFGNVVSYVVSADMQIAVYAGKDMEPDLWSLKVGDRVDITINPEGGFPPLEKGAQA